MAPYQEESSESKMAEQLVILARRYPCVFFSFGLAISWWYWRYMLRQTWRESDTCEHSFVKQRM